MLVVVLTWARCGLSDQGLLGLDLQAIGVQKQLIPTASQLLQIANLGTVQNRRILLNYRGETQ